MIPVFACTKRPISLAETFKAKILSKKFGFIGKIYKERTILLVNLNMFLMTL